MREIESKKEAEKRRRKNQIIISVILIVIMMGSAFGYAFYRLGGNNTESNKVEYKGYEFTNQNDFWATKIGNYEFMFRYNPTQVERIESEGGALNYLNSYSEKPLYIFSENYVAEVEIYRNLGNIVQRFQGACLEEKDCPENWPIKDCSNNFIIIKKANESRIYQNESCTFIEGREENLTQITDEFLFWISGIEN
ncbi:MAG: hypothetical protein NTZ83_04935 [Candidatus Pacearchaeota archaeon]|nr:hypothetical protein [Candidatus Pacearchaeota archaeon]